MSDHLHSLLNNASILSAVIADNMTVNDMATRECKIERLLKFGKDSEIVRPNLLHFRQRFYTSRTKTLLARPISGCFWRAQLVCLTLFNQEIAYFRGLQFSVGGPFTESIKRRDTVCTVSLFRTSLCCKFI